MRGDTASAAGPNTCTILRFSARYWMNTRPLASASGIGGSTTRRAGGSLLSGTTGAGPRISRAVASVAVECVGLRDFDGILAVSTALDEAGLIDRNFATEEAGGRRVIG